MISKMAISRKQTRFKHLPSHGVLVPETQSGKLPKGLKAPELEKALSIIDEMNFTKQEREAYEEHLKWLRVEANTLRKTEGTAYIKGKEEGREEGERRKAAASALEMLKDGMSIEKISQYTGLPTSE